MPSRFNTDQSLFETFPTALRDVGVEPRGTEPTALARSLAAQGKIDEAASLCAYMLGRREAVFWGCRCLRSIRDGDRAYQTRALQAADNWAAEPTELRQTVARDIGWAEDQNDPTTWIARAAGWAGGGFGPAIPIPAEPHLTAVGVRIGMILALSRLKPAEKLERGRACVEDAVRIAEGSLKP